MVDMPTQKDVDAQLTIGDFIQQLTSIPGDYPVVFDSGEKPGRFLLYPKTNQLEISKLGEGEVRGTQQEQTTHSLLADAKTASHDIFPFEEYIQASPEVPLWAFGRPVTGVELDESRDVCVIVTQGISKVPSPRLRGDKGRVI